MSEQRRHALAPRIRWLVTATITYNVVEAIVAIAAGRVADSTARVRTRLGDGGVVSGGGGMAVRRTRTRGCERIALRIILATVSLVVMPVLSYTQRRAGRELGSLSAVADSKQTLLCTYVSAVLLIGLLLNTAFGWA